MPNFNTCGTCGASGSRTGMLTNGDCLNCTYTRRNQAVYLDKDLQRAQSEIDLMISKCIRNK